MTKQVSEYLDMLGLRVADRITGFTGTVTSVHFDIAGCVMCIVSPKVKKSGEIHDSVVVDAKRLDTLPGKRAMPMPDFESVDGPTEIPDSKPAREERARAQKI